MEKRLIGVLVLISLIVLVTPMVLAIKTNMNITTLEGHRISVIVRETGKLSSLESFHNNTKKGNILLSTSVSSNVLDLIVTLRKDGKEKLNEKFIGLDAGQDLYINFIPGDVGIKTEAEFEEELAALEAAKAENETAEANETITDDNESEEEAVADDGGSKPGLTGAAISNIKSAAFSKITYYIVFAIVIVFVVILIARKKVRSKNSPVKIKADTGNKEDKGDKGAVKKDDAGKIEDIENKIKEAKEELDNIKNRKKRLKDAEEKFKKDEEELKRLREEYED